jgi:hypothetical protein
LHDAPVEIRAERGQRLAQESTGERVATEMTSLDEEHWRRLAKAWQKVEYVQGTILDQVKAASRWIWMGSLRFYRPVRLISGRPLT